MYTPAPGMQPTDVALKQPEGLVNKFINLQEVDCKLLPVGFCCILELI